jgi:hypothetical protein
VLVAASPTRGLDVAAIASVHGYLREAAADGMAILLISEDLDEILALADRVVVMYEGAIVGEVDARRRDGRGARLLMAGGGRDDRAHRAAARAAALARVAVPVGSIAVALPAQARPAAHAARPGARLPRLFDAAFVGNGALTQTIVSATPLAFTGLAAAVAFRMQLFNIGAEGQLYVGAISPPRPRSACTRGRRRSDRRDGRGRRRGRGRVGGDPGVLRAFCSHERDHHVADAQLRRRADPQLPDLRQPLVLARHLDARGEGLPAGQAAAGRGDLAAWDRPLGRARDPARLRVAVLVAVVLWWLYSRTRFGFEVQVIGDSPRAARYAGCGRGGRSSR